MARVCVGVKNEGSETKSRDEAEPQEAGKAEPQEAGNNKVEINPSALNGKKRETRPQIIPINPYPSGAVQMLTVARITRITTLEFYTVILPSA